MAKLTDDEIVGEARQRLDDAWTQDRENRIQGFSDLRFMANDHWPEDMRQQREREGRPCLTINRLPQFVHQVANAVRTNPPSLSAIPCGGGATQELAEIYSGLFRQIQRRSKATSVYARALFYAVACGIGHFRMVTDYVGDNVFDQEIKIKNVPFPFSVFWDPAATEVTREDAEYCLVSDFIGTSRFKERWPGASLTDFDYPSEMNAEKGLFWSISDAIRVCEYWVKEFKKREIVRLETGETIDVTDLPHNEVSQLPILVSRKINSYEIKQYLCSGVEVLDEKVWPGRHIPIFPVIGTEIALESKIARSGLITNAKDAQQSYNYWRSAAAETIALAPKSPFLVTPEMISKFKGQWDTANRVNRPYMLYEAGPNGERPQREAPPDVPTAFTQESGLASDEMKATTGVYDAALGARSNEISGIAIKARESQGNNATYHYQDNLVITLNHLGAALVDLIPKVYDADRVITLLGDDEKTVQNVRINIQVPGPDGKPIKLNDMSVGEFEVGIKMGPDYSTRRQEAASSMLELVQTLPETGQIIDDLIVEVMDFPGAEEAARRLRAAKPPAITGDQPSPEQMQQQQAQQQFAQGMQSAQLQEAQAKGLKTASEAAKTHIEATILAKNGGEQTQAPQVTDQRTPEDVAGARMKNALLYQDAQQKQATLTDTTLRIQGRQLDNAHKLQVLTQPKTEPIP